MGTKGERLTNPLQLFDETSVWVERWQRPCAIGFLVMMQLSTLKGYFEHGVYKYTKQDKSNKKQFHEVVKWKQD